ncbi:MAG: CinA family nicotinamide mononucleotide deamidase-related protein [Chitinophagaceae bacterium]
MNPSSCIIITIGDELLIGQTIDTNSAWLAQELNTLGIEVLSRVAVGDTKLAITQAIDDAKKNAKLIILTGGLGPTSDDITKPLLCEYFNTTLIENKDVKEHVMQLFTKRNVPLLDVNIKQALVPASCKVLFNQVGTAPGMLFDEPNFMLISLPGVPFEMKHIMQHGGLDAIQKKIQLAPRVHKTLQTHGLGESFVAQRLQNFEQKLPPYIKLAYLPHYGIVKLRLSTENKYEDKANLFFQELKTILNDIVFFEQDLPLEDIINRYCIEKNLTLSVAESCTGGSFSGRLCDIKNASLFFKGGYIVYAISAKEHVLGISKEILQTHGAISEATAIEMAKQCRLHVPSHISVSVTGNLEPDTEQPYAWICIHSDTNTVTKKINLPVNRLTNKEYLITQLFIALIRFIH